MADRNESGNALQLLAADHRKVEELFERYGKAKGTDAKRKLVEEICTELKIHSMIEEEIYYPAIRGKVEDDDLDEAYVEHDGAKVLINELEAGEPSEEFYDAKVKVLQEEIEHHVKEEEKQSGNLFQQTRQADVDLDELGRRLKERKQELMERAQSEGLPPAKTRTFEHGEA